MSVNPLEYFRILSKHFDTTKRTELYYTNEFTLAIAVILSAQATDKHVNTVTPTLFAIADTPEKFLALGLEGLKEHIKSISFFNNKAKNIILLAEKLSSGNEAKKSGEECFFPEKYHDRNELMTLPGIGQKTANVISNVLWNAANIGVDTHVFRLAHRFGWADDSDNTPEKVEKKLIALIPEDLRNLVNHLMVMHGRYICKAPKPDCLNCPVYDICDFEGKIKKEK